METLVIKRKSFWMRLYRFLFMMDKYETLPDNTCNLRRDLIFGSIIGLFILPLIIVFNIIKWLSDFSMDYSNRYGLPIAFAFISLVLCLPAHETGLFNPVFLPWIGACIGIFITIFLLVVAFIVIGFNHINWSWFFPKSNKPKKTKSPSVIKELYSSAKEKYCKRITYI